MPTLILPVAFVKRSQIYDWTKSLTCAELNLQSRLIAPDSIPKFLAPYLANAHKYFARSADSIAVTQVLGVGSLETTYRMVLPNDHGISRGTQTWFSFRRSYIGYLTAVYLNNIPVSYTPHELLM